MQSLRASSPAIGKHLPDLLLVVVIAVGVAARIDVGTYPYSQTIFDLHSYEIVGQLAATGQNVYAHTGRYNYAPAWFLVLDLFWRLSHADTVTFAWLIRSLLTAVDVAIALVLWRSVGRLAAALFILNPISIMVTGVQLQFDNAAVLVALATCAVVQSRRLEESDSLAGLLVPALALGCSLVVKHDCLLFPFWLAFRRRFDKRQLAALLLPYTVFALSFVPYLSAWRGIKADVIDFRPGSEAPLGHLLGALRIDGVHLSSVVFVLAVLAVGWSCRRLPLLHAFAAYLAAIVALSPGIDLEYLAIPVVAVAVLFNAFFGAYTVLVTLWFLSSGQLALHLDLGWPWLTNFVFHGFAGLLQAACLLLLAGLAWRALAPRWPGLLARLGVAGREHPVKRALGRRAMSEQGARAVSAPMTHAPCRDHAGAWHDCGMVIPALPPACQGS